jgi:hypothetical protein
MFNKKMDKQVNNALLEGLYPKSGHENQPETHATFALQLPLQSLIAHKIVELWYRFLQIYPSH